MKKGLVVLAVSLAALAAAPAAHADDRECTGLEVGMQYDNVIVRGGFFCVLENAQVRGSVTVFPNGDLTIDQSTIQGNVHTALGTTLPFDLMNSTRVLNSTVGGSIQTGEDVGIEIAGNLVGGNITVVGTRVGPSNVVDNTVGGNLQYFNNNGVSNISGNNVGGDLQCSENTPPPIGGGNTASSKEGQCAAL
jgi:hypothetical protein